MKTVNGEKSLRKPWLQNSPGELQERLMRALRDDGESTSAVLAKKVGLEPHQVRGYCLWLLKNAYITQRVRKVRKDVLGRTVWAPTQFWSLPSKGVEYLASKHETGSSEPSVA